MKELFTPFSVCSEPSDISTCYPSYMVRISYLSPTYVPSSLCMCVCV